jgi:Na+/phosphate symporter
MERLPLERTAREADTAADTPVRQEIQRMCQMALEMLGSIREAFRRQDLQPLGPAERLGREIHRMEKALIARDPLFVAMHLERIGDNAELLCRAVRTMVQDGIPFSERAMREIDTLLDKVMELLECVRDVLPTGNRVLIRHVLAEGRRLEELAHAYGLEHQQRLIEGVCMPRASSLYLALLDDLRGVEWHTRKMAEKLAATPGPGGA